MNWKRGSRDISHDNRGFEGRRDGLIPRTCELPRRNYFVDLKLRLHCWPGQFHQHAYAQPICSQIPKAQKDSQVSSRKKVEWLVELLYFSGFVLYAVPSTLVKLRSKFHQHFTGSFEVSQSSLSTRGLLLNFFDAWCRTYSTKVGCQF